ncbi:MAG: hypothetical protein GY727_13420 [Gammaproteobacteria bacterium]|nr:hypothetical protein [Gammaproteobacteria bacterium]MCP4088285.1 hypothetical protein [Gammaproteobacteria bacterium]MCP4276404.1 hypothetical protein [Gammaproteobacteria bacterium]MCP4831051.1 hypothetical protein [Gammaproteobacteria bacterium]MCP4927428.1 hypothetical protein [Gammaproteobacteria bacterium]
MSFPITLSTVHAGSAILLLILAHVSVGLAVWIAVKPAKDQGNLLAVNTANRVGFIENLVAGILTVTGLVLAIQGPWAMSELWLWMSLVIMIFYMVALVRITKPARMEVARSGSEIKTGMQCILQIGHVLLLIVAFSLMLLKPV